MVEIPEIVDGDFAQRPQGPLQHAGLPDGIGKDGAFFFTERRQGPGRGGGHGHLMVGCGRCRRLEEIRDQASRCRQAACPAVQTRLRRVMPRAAQALPSSSPGPRKNPWQARGRYRARARGDAPGLLRSPAGRPAGPRPVSRLGRHVPPRPQQAGTDMQPQGPAQHTPAQVPVGGPGQQGRLHAGFGSKAHADDGHSGATGVQPATCQQGEGLRQGPGRVEALLPAAGQFRARQYQAGIEAQHVRPKGQGAAHVGQKVFRLVARHAGQQLHAQGKARVPHQTAGFGALPAAVMAFTGLQGRIGKSSGCPAPPCGSRGGAGAPAGPHPDGRGGWSSGNG